MPTWTRSPHQVSSSLRRDGRCRRRGPRRGGTSAVVAARQAGGEVLAVEHGLGPGGTSAKFGRTHLPGRRDGFANGLRLRDSPENMVAFLRAALGPGVDDDRVDAYARVRPTISIGWSPSACPSGRRSATSRTVNQPMTRGCSSAAVRTAIRSTKLHVPVPRWHKPRWTDSAGGFLMERLGAAAAGASPRLSGTRAEALVVDDGEVVGVQVRSDEGTRAIRRGRGHFGRRWVHLQRSHGRGAVPFSPRAGIGMADRHPERRRPRDPHGRRGRRG